MIGGEGQNLKINGIDLWVRRFGDPNLPALIVIHGGPTCYHSYLLPAVAELDVVGTYRVASCARQDRPACDSAFSAWAASARTRSAAAGRSVIKSMASLAQIGNGGRSPCATNP